MKRLTELDLGHFNYSDNEVVVYNHNRTPEEHRAYNLLKEAYRRATYQEGLLLDRPVAPTPQRQASIELIRQWTLDRIGRTHARAVLHSPVWNEYRLSIGSWTPDQASLEFTILDELEHWVLRDVGYDADDELPSLVNTEQESSAGNPPSPGPLDILSLLTRIRDNASALYDITNHHPTLTPISEQAHIQVLIEQVQLVLNTLHNLQRLISPPLPPIPISHDPEEDLADLHRVADHLKAVDPPTAADPLQVADPLKDLADHHLWLLSAYQAPPPAEPKSAPPMFLTEIATIFAPSSMNSSYQSRIVTTLTFMDGLKTFQPIEEAATAASKLYHLDYRPAALDTFNAEFFRLCALAGILEDSAQLSFYKERLPESMRRRVRLTYPIPTTVNEWAAWVLEIEHSNYVSRTALTALHFLFDLDHCLRLPSQRQLSQDGHYEQLYSRPSAYQGLDSPVAQQPAPQAVSLAQAALPELNLLPEDLISRSTPPSRSSPII
ncbi:hypothetical protein DICSQDRAFT_168825 [Dichomitus squalens LYAD-421 SS1]|uniref:uncharacterized protein n=1 Tax=Dichomitus squalens (strain LYAD-421) TaxID=732165 RepID=UPI00044146D7|nr:uncharacterized protein DICSQDRAFT_168825 [Dichomitus squalens LYAD-421 SS1]EJF63151.1 hypothetical protein DICSQDRAFT_168825 [Dichomitus squalens LYAD-421 SS1]